MTGGQTTAIYRWWPRYRPGTVELGGAGPRELARTVAAVLVIAGVIALPPIARTVGIAPATVLLIGVSYASLMAANDLLLHPAAMKSARWFHLQLIVVQLYNALCCASIVVIPGDPKSPLWMTLFVWACTTAGWQEIDHSIAFLLYHAIFPLLTIPVFLLRGADPGWSWAGPILCAVYSGLAYHLIGSVSATWRRVRAEQQATIDELRRQAAETERARIARDIHDSVGSVLGLIGLYSDVIERNVDKPADLRRIAGTLREAAREGLGDLRGVLDALAPDAADLSSLGRTLRRIAQRATDSGTVRIDVAVDGDTNLPIDGPQRLSLVRVFQESVTNALRHGQAKSIGVSLEATPGGILLTVTDDGCGFSPDSATTGRGLRGMRGRAEELGGLLHVSSTPGAGARIALTLPVRPDVRMMA
jgi:signal transduction histidine kinase